MRLPELSAGSPLKQDPRSDLSFVSGILFYLLTGQNPDVLQDAEGRLPHQRHEAHAKLQQTAGIALPRLLSLFDSAFAPQIADRITNADVMLDGLEGVVKPRATRRSEEDLLQGIREMMDTQAARRRADTHTRLGEALNQIQRVHEEIRKSLDFPVFQRQSNRHVSGAAGSNTLEWIQPGSDDAILSLRCEAQETG